MIHSKRTPRKRTRYLVVTFLFGLFLLTGTAWAAADDPQTKRLKQLKAQREKLEKALKVEMKRLFLYLRHYDRIQGMEAAHGRITTKQAADRLDKRARQVFKGSYTQANLDKLKADHQRASDRFFERMNKAVAASKKWPRDASASTYRSRAKAELKKVRAAFKQRLAAGKDPADLLQRANLVLNWTRGRSKVPRERRFFKAQKERIVAALAKARVELVPKVGKGKKEIRVGAARPDQEDRPGTKEETPRQREGRPRKVEEKPARTKTTTSTRTKPEKDPPDLDKILAGMAERGETDQEDSLGSLGEDKPTRPKEKKKPQVKIASRPEKSEVAPRGLAESGWGYYRQGEYSLAEHQFRAALDHQPGEAKTWYGLGLTRGKQGDKKEWVKCLKKAIELSPRSGSYQNGLGNAYYSQKNLREAAQAYRRATVLSPKSGTYQANLAGVLYLQARAAAKKAYSRGKKDHWVMKRLGIGKGKK